MNSDSIFSLNIISILIIFLIVLVILNIVILIIYVSMYRKYVKKYNNIWSKFDNKNFEKDIQKLMEHMENTSKDAQNAKMICSEIDGKMMKCVQKIGFVKYDAYESGNNELSFVLVILDNDNDGILLNSIYNRNYSNIYAKEIIKGEVNGILSEEEKVALSKAINYKSFM